MKCNQAGYKSTQNTYVEKSYQNAEKWLHHASQRGLDETTRFLNLWIAFGALVDNSKINPSESSCFRTRFHDFLSCISLLDTERLIESGLWQSYSNTIRLLLDSRYTFKPYWDHKNGLISKADWAAALKRNNRVALRALEKRDSATLVKTLFDRIYTLRNQLLHGSFSPNDPSCFVEIRSATQVMTVILPACIKLVSSSYEPNQEGSNLSTRH